MKRDVDVLDMQVAYAGFFSLERYTLRHSLFEGGMSPPITRELLERGHAAALLPYDPRRDEVILIEQFRIGALNDPRGPWLMEIVAGIIEEGESPEQVVRREVMEEAGCRVQAIEQICDYLVSPGGTSERITLYCGHVDSSDAGGVHGLAHEGEDILVHKVSFSSAMAMLASGRVDSASPIIALQWLAANRERLRAAWV